jgi:hypothetical protein
MKSGICRSRLLRIMNLSALVRTEARSKARRSEATRSEEGECAGNNKELYNTLQQALMILGTPKYHLPAPVYIRLSVGTREYIGTAQHYPTSQLY